MKKMVRRRKYYVDNQVQSALVGRVIRYWLLSLFIVGTLTFLGWMFVYPGIGSLVGPGAVLPEAVPVFVMGIISTCLLLPWALRDLIRFSNRFVGPILRIRRVMKEFAEGKAVAAIHLREGDYWQDLADVFNQLLERYQTDELEPNGVDASENDPSLSQVGV
ncbi:MAG: hypothetical protein KDA57_16455 [Planctomycetales bacterium]|nr:hypothetical protein [Planctomycetales bacterium]